MKGITYQNTKTTISGWRHPLHVDHPIGYAYETSTHFVHMYGAGQGLWVISTALTVIQKKDGRLIDWVEKVFGATNIEELDNEIGHSVKGVWRPSLYFYDDTFQALEVNDNEMKLSENSLRLLIQKLDEIFLYIEPDISSLNVYSHKTRELLILACTEVENFLQYYIRLSNRPAIHSRNSTMKDYVTLLDKLHLKDYEFTLKTYSNISPIKPFDAWDLAKPSISLSWYDAYNKTKHDRDKYFSKATLISCINAVAACLILHCVKFSPFPLFEQTNAFSSLINQHFKARVVGCNPRSFYLPELNLPTNSASELIMIDPKSNGYLLPFVPQPFL